MKIFISGVTGYLGRNLARHLIHEHDVVGMSRDIDKSSFLEDLGVKIFNGDLHSNNLKEGIKGCDVVIHTTADTDHKNISKTQYDTNVTGTQLILRAAEAAEVKQFIHISTDSVLLTGKALHNVTEYMPYPKKTVGSYSESKQLAEKMVLNSNSDNLSVIVLRPRFVWGRDDTTALPQILNAIKNDEFAWINGGNYKTSTTHIANLCNAVTCAIDRGISGETYFVTDDDDRTFKEVISALVEAHGSSVPTKSIPRFIPRTIAKLDNLRRKILPKSGLLPLTMQEYSTSAVEVTLDISKAKSQLKYKPVVSFREGLTEIKKQL